MPTYRPRKKPSIKQKTTVRQSVIVNIARMPSRPRTQRSGKRLTTQDLLKTLIMRPPVSNVVTVGNTQPDFETMRSVAAQEKAIMDIMEKQALMNQKLQNIQFQRTPEGILEPEVAETEKETLREDFERSRVVAQEKLDEMMKSSPFALKPVEKPTPIQEAAEELITEVPEIREPTPKKEYKKKDITELIADIKEKSLQSQLSQLKRKIKKPIVEAYRALYSLPETATKDEIIDVVENRLIAERELKAESGSITPRK